MNLPSITIKIDINYSFTANSKMAMNCFSIFFCGYLWLRTGDVPKSSA